MKFDELVEAINAYGKLKKPNDYIKVNENWFKQEYGTLIYRPKGLGENPQKEQIENLVFHGFTVVVDNSVDTFELVFG